MCCCYCREVYQKYISKQIRREYTLLVVKNYMTLVYVLLLCWLVASIFGLCE